MMMFVLLLFRVCEAAMPATGRATAPATGARPDVVASGRARGVHAALRRARPGQFPFSLSLSLFIVGLGRTPLRSHSSLDLVEHSCSHTHRWTWIEHSCS